MTMNLVDHFHLIATTKDKDSRKKEASQSTPVKVTVTIRSLEEAIIGENTTSQGNRANTLKLKILLGPS